MKNNVISFFVAKLFVTIATSEYNQNSKAHERGEDFNYDYENWDEQTTTSISSTHQTSKYTVDPNRYNPNVNEIWRQRNVLGSGLFTASLAVFLDILNDKPAKHSFKIIEALEAEGMRLRNKTSYDKFEQLVPGIIESFINVLANTKIVTSFATERENISADVKTVINLVDSVYNDSDVNNIANVLLDLQDYPRTPYTDKQIAQELLEAFLYTPFKRIIGTELEKLIVVAITNVFDLRRIRIFSPVSQLSID